MSGSPDTGSIHRGGELCGFPADGSLAPGAMSTSPDLGARCIASAKESRMNFTNHTKLDRKFRGNDPAALRFDLRICWEARPEEPTTGTPIQLPFLHPSKDDRSERRP
jgi:hypothetical protein